MCLITTEYHYQPITLSLTSSVIYQPLDPDIENVAPFQSADVGEVS